MLGKKIKQFIESSPYSFVDVAKAIGITPQGLYKIIKKDSIETKYLIKLSEYLNIPLTKFFENENNEKDVLMEDAKTSSYPLEGFGIGIHDDLQEIKDKLNALLHPEPYKELYQLKVKADNQEKELNEHKEKIDTVKYDPVYEDLLRFKQEIQRIIINWDDLKEKEHLKVLEVLKIVNNYSKGGQDLTKFINELISVIYEKQEN